jgi:glycosyltransferase involved in cell wall biosynthesis
MRILYIHSSYSPNDLIGGWFRATREHLRKNGGDAWFAIKFRHGGQQPDDIMVGDSVSCGIHARIFDYTGLQDMWSVGATKKFLRKVDEIKPDIIHCHVINDFFLNMKLFVDYVNKNNIKVIWTFHDARVLTGECPYPMYVPCSQWVESCKKCPNSNTFLVPSKGWMNAVGMVHEYRKRTIGRIENLTIVTPSNWMKSLVQQSYLKDIRCEVIHNGINLNVFHPVESNIRERYGITVDKKLLLAVGNPLWTLKGRDYLLRLIDELPDSYFIVLIGALDEDVQNFKNHNFVLALPRISRDQLVEFYSAADLFVNPTLADNFPTVNLEAQACGCPVVAFDSDGTPETIASCGVVVPRMDYEVLKRAVLGFEYDQTKTQSLSFAREYSEVMCIHNYQKLYEEAMIQ